MFANSGRQAIKAAVFLLAVNFLNAQSNPAKLADQARGLEPELTADILFLLPPSRENFEEIFALAPRVRNPAPLDDAVGVTDTRSWATARAFRMGLDSLSIRCRAARAMVGLDAARAREMFLSITPPSSSKPRCEDALAADVSIYFDTAGELAKSGLLDLGPAIRSISTAMALPAAARLIRTAPLSLDERTRLLTAYSARMAELDDSARSTALAVNGLKLPGELIQLAQDCVRRNLSADGLIGAYRAFLLRAASGERCAGATLDGAIESFNQRLRWGGYLVAEDLPALPAASATTQASTGSKAVSEYYWRTRQSKRLLAAIRHLRFGAGVKPVSLEQKATPEWIAEAGALLDDLQAWNAAEEPSATDSFHEEAILYGSVLEVLPDGDPHDRAARMAVGFLAGSPIRDASPIEWLLELKTLLDLPDSGAIAKAALAHADPAIALYAALTYRK